MSDTASLIVRVSSTGVAKTDRELDGLSNSANKADKSSLQLAKTARAAGPVIAAVGASVAIATSALTAMVISSASSQRELTNLSRTAKTTREDFAALSFVFKQYNVDAKGTADAMNDVSERLGEFAAAGTGPFQDFADVMNMTKEDAVSLANELQRLRPEDAIQRMVKSMEDAGTQGAQMSFVMKSMSNDLEYASGAFAENGKVINSLKSRFSELNKEIALTSGQASQLQQTAESFSLLTGAFGTASDAISATLAPTMDDFFNSVISVVPNATNTIVDFINTFNEAADIQSVKQIDAQMKSLADTIENGVKKGYDKMSRSMNDNPLNFVRVGKYQDAVQRLNELEQQKNKILEEQAEKELSLAKIRSGGTIGGIGNEASKVSGNDAKLKADKLQSDKDAAAAYIETLRQANLNEQQLIETQQRDKAQVLADFYLAGLVSEQEYRDSLTEIAATSAAESNAAELDSESRMLAEKKAIRDRFESLVSSVDPIAKLELERQQRLATISMYDELEGANHQASLDAKAEADRIYSDGLAAAQEERFRSLSAGNEYLISSLDSLSSAGSSALAGIITETTTAEDAVKMLGRAIIGQGVSALVEFGTQQLKNIIIGQASSAAAVGAAVATGTSMAAAYAPAAALASLASFGANAVPAATGIASTVALSQGLAIAGAREQGGYMQGGSAYQMAERGKAEVIVPAGNSIAKTAAQMKDIMGQSGGSGVAGVTIINQTTGRIDNASTEMDNEGMLRIMIKEEVVNGLLNQDSSIAKARKASANQPGF